MDRPNLDELLEALGEFLEEEILPGLTDPRLRFRTLVALNALGIARRELLLGGALAEEDRRELGALLGLEAPLEELLRALGAKIREGRAPPGTLSFLKAHVARKLQVASPKYLERYP